MMTDKSLFEAFVLLFLSSLFSPGLTFAQKPKYGPETSPRATPLAASPEFFKNSKNNSSAFWPLISHYHGQLTGASCSSASLAMVLNAARALLPKTADDANVTEKLLWERANVDHWKERLSEVGYEGKHGADLAELAKVSEVAFKTLGFSRVSVKTVQINSITPKMKARVIEDLKKLSGKTFFIANFNQKNFTDDADVGHFAPIGAFDEGKNKVLVLDPDREYYEPYWVSVDTLLSGMNTVDSSGKVYRGYLLIQSSGN